MSGVPAFSIFSAISEVFVTIAVLYGILTNLKGRPLMVRLLGAVLTFELLVNVLYMAGRAAKADSDTTLTTAMKIFFAGHGILSLVMFVGLVALFVVSVFDHKAGNPTWFQRHRTGTYIFLVFWMISVLSGETIFFWRYGAQLFG